MAKVEISPISNLQNESTAVANINNNFTRIQTIIETLLSRDGLSPNYMTANLDMNGQRIINLPEPVSDLDAVRLRDIKKYIDEMKALLEEAQDLIDRLDEIQEIVNSFNSTYLGPFASDPPGVHPTGTLYLNTTTNSFKAYKAGTGWINLPSGSLASLTDVSVSGVVSGQVLGYNGTNWVPVSQSGGVTPGQITNLQNQINALNTGLSDLDSKAEKTVNKGTATGYAGLASGKLLDANLPARIMDKVPSAVTGSMNSGISNGFRWVAPSASGKPTTTFEGGIIEVSFGSEFVRLGIDKNTSNTYIQSRSGSTISPWVPTSPTGSSSTDPEEINYPVGSYLLAGDAYAAQVTPNRDVTPLLLSNGQFTVSTAATGQTLAGTWRTRGSILSGGGGMIVLIQRVS